MVLLLAASSSAVLARPHPCLYLTREEITQARAKAHHYPWAQAILERLVKAARDAEPAPVAVPEWGGGHMHNYYCPQDASRLTFDPQRPKEHVCPRCGHTYTGEPYDSAWRWGVHQELQQRLRGLTLGYALSRNRGMAERIAEILRGYAQRYPHYPVQRAKGRTFMQSLDESVWLIQVAWAYDQIYDSRALSAEDKELIERDLLLASAHQIQSNTGGGNWQSWHNAALGAVGFLLDDRALIEYALHRSKSGFDDQLKNEVMPDGLQFELSASCYHFYTLMAHRWLAEAARHAGVDLYASPGYEGMYLAPLKLVTPDFALPSLNDGWAGGGLTSNASLYEIAYARWRSPALGLALKAIYRHHPRNSAEALLWGEAALPDAEPAPPASTLLPASGLAVLRDGERSYALLDYGPHGGGHGHPDKLNLVVWADGRWLAPDLGTPGYGVPLYPSWYKQSLAHNLVVVDQASQQATTGKLLHFGVAAEVKVADASADGAYPGVQNRRTIFLTRNYLLEVCRLSSEQEHTYDWVWHTPAKAEADLPMRPVDPPFGEMKNGYQHLAALQRARVEAPWYVTWKGPGWFATLHLLGHPGTEAFLGQGPGFPAGEPMPVLLVRRHGRHAVFASVMELRPSASRLSKIELLPAMMGDQLLSEDEAVGLRVDHAGGSEYYLLATAPGEKQFEDFSFDGALATIAIREGQVRYAYVSDGVLQSDRYALQASKFPGGDR